MIVIDLDPSVHLGPITLAWHGIFTAVGIFFGVWLATKLVAKRVSEADASAIATWGVVAGIIGARVFHVADCWTGTECVGIPGGYSAHPELIPQIWTGGIAVWGAAIGGVLGGLIAAVRRGTVPIGFTADAAAPAIALGFAIGRIGDIINGEHHAVACEPPLGICVEYAHPATLGQGSSSGVFYYSADPVHLVVGYDMAWNLVGMGLALALRGRGLRDGLIFWLWTAWYAVGRFLLGYLRTGDPSYAFAMREDQIIAILVLAAAIPMIVRLWPRGPRREVVTA